MKKMITLGLLLFSGCLFSQNYNFDPTFGTSGIKIFENSGLNPIDGLLIDSNYYFISYNQFRKMAYNGSGDTSFGTNGIVTINANQNPNNQYPSYITGFKFIDNYFYIYGTADKNNGDNGFIYKIDPNGNLDTSFGTNGAVIINFGAAENVSDIVSDSNGNLLCIGSRVVTENSTISSQLVYFKVNSATGAVNTSFDTNGYKVYSGIAYSRGIAIQKTGNNFML